MHERRKPLWLRPKAERRVALLELQRECGFGPPEGWLRLLWRRGARRGALPVPPGAFVLWPAEEVLQLNQHFDVDGSYPGLFGFGSDGGPSLLAFDTRSGFCEHYAGALVFMLRAMDVPARVVTG